jgi:hypothetical protein
VFGENEDTCQSRAPRREDAAPLERHHHEAEDEDQGRPSRRARQDGLKRFAQFKRVARRNSNNMKLKTNIKAGPRVVKMRPL